MVTIDETLAREILDRLMRLETLAVENNRQINERIDATNARITEIHERMIRLETRMDSLEARMHERLESSEARQISRMDTQDARNTSRMDKLFFTMIGLGAAVIASLVAGQILD